MKDLTANLKVVLTQLEEYEFTERKKDFATEMKIAKFESGMSTLQERVKIKDDIIGDLKETITFLKGGKKEEKK